MSLDKAVPTPKHNYEDRGEVIEKLGLKSGLSALMASGMQPEFAKTQMFLQHLLRTNMVFRAGSFSVFGRHRVPKPGTILSKTSNQGFFKGAIAKERIFTRTKNGIVIGHHDKDHKRLDQDKKDGPNIPIHQRHQPTVQLTIRLRDILRELREGGDLELVSSHSNGEMRFKYKQGKGDSSFKGEFVINWKEGKEFVAKESRDWDNERSDPDFNVETQIIKKPPHIAMSDEDWESFYREAKGDEEHPEKEFPLWFHDGKDKSNLKPAEVFSNAEGVVISGDWDGLALGFPVDEEFILVKNGESIKLNPNQVFNTFDLNAPIGLTLVDLFNSTCDLLTYYQQKIRAKQAADPQYEMSPMDYALLELTPESDGFCNHFALSRAGCITPFEFLHNILLNYFYRVEAGMALRKSTAIEVNDFNNLKKAYEAGIQVARQLLLNSKPPATREQAIEAAKKEAKKNYLSCYSPERRNSDTFRVTHQKAIEHLNNKLLQTIALYQNEISDQTLDGDKLAPFLTISHPEYDENMQNLMQHGFDMRNPYGSNLDGAWIIITNDQMVIYGNTEEQLIEFMLRTDFLETNDIDVNPLANMAAGWYKIVIRQQELGRDIPPKTLEALKRYQDRMQLSERIMSEGAPQPEQTKAKLGKRIAAVISYYGNPSRFKRRNKVGVDVNEDKPTHRPGTTGA